MVARMACGRLAVGMGILALCAVVMAAGCSASHARPESAPAAKNPAAASQPAASATEKPAADKPAANDPLSMLREALVSCESLAGYEIVFHRQERRGLISAKLCDWEDMRVFYRKQPSSIKATWTNPDSEYAEVVYVEGVNDGKVTVLPRKGLLGLPPMAASVAPDEAVKWGKSLRPITDFGLAAMVRRTLGHIEQAKESGGAIVTYEGQAPVERLGTRAHRIVVRYPEGFTRAAKQDIYISTETGYPVGTFIWLPNGELLAAYLYEKPVMTVPGDEVFAMPKARTTLAKKE